MGLPHGAPTAAKIAPRRVFDRLGSLLFASRFSVRFLIAFGFVFVPLRGPNGPPGMHQTGGTPPPWGTQAGHMVVLVRLFVRLEVWDRFGTLFGPSWGYVCPLLVPCSAFLGPIFGLWMLFGDIFWVDVRFSVVAFAICNFRFCRCCT